MIIAGIAIGVLLLMFIGLYNGLVRKRNQVENAFASIDTMLKKRHDLIPNLVSTVKQYMTHERETLEKITELRAKAVAGNTSSDQRVALENEISGALQGIMVAVENYPDLKSNTNFQDLQASLNVTEDEIAASRRFFNSAVTTYNNAIETFPGSMVAGMFSFTRKAVFVIPEVERANPNVKDLWSK